jgi:geranylgeranyl diphosphate synthase, type I
MGGGFGGTIAVASAPHGSCDTHGVSEDRSAEPAVVSPTLDHARLRVDPAIERFLADRHTELAAMGSGAAVLVDELLRLIGAGGKRIRPALCLWAYRACGGANEPAIAKAAAALELLHTFALVHDDVMDRSDERRGVPASHVRFAKDAPPGADPDAYGTAVAILAGDLAAVLSEQLLRTCGAATEPLAVALGRFDRMRVEMAAGQFLDLSRGAASAARARVAALKTGSYTVEGPVLIGAALAAAGSSAEGSLRVYGRMIGEAFQLRDDVIDGDADPKSVVQVDDLVDRGIAALDGAPLEGEGASALVEIAGLLRLGGNGRA